MRKMLAMMLASIAASALAVAPSTATGETESPQWAENVQAADEATLDICDNVVVLGAGGLRYIASGCVFHADSNGTVNITTHSIFGEAVVSQCNWEFTGAVDAGGQGMLPEEFIHITNLGGTGIDCPPAAGGTRRCTPSESAGLGATHGADWGLRFVEEDTDGSIWMEVSLCMGDVGPFDWSIGGNLWFRANNHLQTLSATDHRLRSVEHPPGDVELTGSWSVTENGLEFGH